ncbi:MAG TPA: flagellar basal body-associated FliL family protein [Labilithrix sp.]|nr:flagellar basal body-associated FliL family protein [Labilithrix sp.]
MSTETKPATPAAEAPAAAPAKKPSAIGGLLKFLIPAVLAAGAAYGGTRAASAHNTTVIVQQATQEQHAEGQPPGPTLPLEPFLVTLFDANKRAHPMKMSLAVEFDAHTKEDLKNFVPRIRDGVLAYLRTLSHEQVTDPGHAEKMRTELLERCKAAGANTAQRILVTDFVVQ